MGILTTDLHHNDGFAAKLFKTQSTKLSLVCYLSAFVCCFMLINENYIGSTYFSDNALLPGLVNRDYNQVNLAQQMYKSLLSESQKLSYHFPDNFIYQQFQKLGLHVYRHNYTLNYPFGFKQVSLTSKRANYFMASASSTFLLI